MYFKVKLMTVKEKIKLTLLCLQCTIFHNMLDVELALSPGENLSFVCEEQEKGFASFCRNSWSTASVQNKLPFPFAALSKSVAALCRRGFVRIKASKISRQERIQNVFWFG